MVCFLPVGFPCRYGEVLRTESLGIVFRSSLLTELGMAKLGERKFKRFYFSDVM